MKSYLFALSTAALFSLGTHVSTVQAADVIPAGAAIPGVTDGAAPIDSPVPDPSMTPNNQSAQPRSLTGDKLTACQVILCLPASKRPGECMSPLRKFFSIKKPHKKLRFLKLCPKSGGNDSQFNQFLEAISNSAGGGCEAEDLNRPSFVYRGRFGEDGDQQTIISDRLPAHCAAYYNHQYIRGSDVALRYVGTPERGGFWVRADGYEAALAEYNRRIAIENARNAESQIGSSLIPRPVMTGGGGAGGGGSIDESVRQAIK